MKYRLEILINKSRAEVWNLFCDYEKISLWQPSIIKIEPVSGTTGQIGAISKWIYKASDREYFLTETILSREESTHFENVFRNEFAENSVNNIFTEQGMDQTLWATETKYKFKTLLMIILGPFMKNRYKVRSKRDMERFKELVEKE
jgi:hypothetical protein